MGKPGEGKGGEKEPLYHTILSLVPRLRCCQRLKTCCRQEEKEKEAGGQQRQAPPETEQPQEQSSSGSPGVHW